MNLCAASRKWLGISLFMASAAALAAEAQIIDLRIVARKAEGGVRTVQVPQGSEVELRVTSDEAMEIHVHGYDVEVSARPGNATTVSLTARFTGRFPVTAHLPAPPAGAPAREATLLYLEVHPQ